MPKSGPTQKCTLIDPCDPKATHLAAIQSHQTNGFINNKKALEGKGAIWKREINFNEMDLQQRPITYMYAKPSRYPIQ